MYQRTSYRRVVGLAVLLFFIFSTLVCLIPTALAGGGSGEPMNNPPPNSPGGTSYKSPSLWQYFVLYYVKYLKSNWRWVVL